MGRDTGIRDPGIGIPDCWPTAHVSRHLGHIINYQVQKASWSRKRKQLQVAVFSGRQRNDGLIDKILQHAGHIGLIPNETTVFVQQRAGF